MSFTSQYLQCAGLEIHYTDWGKAEKGTVIAWHGLARTGRDMDELAAAEGWDAVVAPELLPVMTAAFADSENAARPGRSRSCRPRKLAAKCWAAAAEAPLPQASTLPPPVTLASTACVAASTTGARAWAHWYLRSALSMNCCWMRCRSMGR